MNSPLMQPDEIERFFASHNNNQLVVLSGQRPMQLDRVAYYEHKAFRHLHEADPSHG
ncbi:MAG: type IV secretory system conjugative DNA transfer family protein [Hyphomicrobiaceae bacterium]|nr:type IV secretory system conjugative DNA transfer family protein [Hyphomicrobiaceae bacterium]